MLVVTVPHLYLGSGEKVKSKFGETAHHQLSLFPWRNQIFFPLHSLLHWVYVASPVLPYTSHCCLLFCRPAPPQPPPPHECTLNHLMHTFPTLYGLTAVSEKLVYFIYQSLCIRWILYSPSAGALFIYQFFCALQISVHKGNTVMVQGWKNIAYCKYCLPTLPIHNVPPLATEYMGTTRGTVHTARMTPSTCRYCHHCLTLKNVIVWMYSTMSPFGVLSP